MVNGEGSPLGSVAGSAVAAGWVNVCLHGHCTGDERPSKGKRSHPVHCQQGDYPKGAALTGRQGSVKV